MFYYWGMMNYNIPEVLNPANRKCSHAFWKPNLLTSLGHHPITVYWTCFVLAIRVRIIIYCYSIFKFLWVLTNLIHNMSGGTVMEWSALSPHSSCLSGFPLGAWFSSTAPKHSEITLKYPQLEIKVWMVICPCTSPAIPCWDWFQLSHNP